MKIKDILTISRISFLASTFLMILIAFAGLSLGIKQILAPIAITLFGFFLVTFLFSMFINLKNEDSDYFRNVIIGIAGGLAVWFFSGINFSFPNGILLGLNDMIIKLAISFMVLYLGYLVCKKKEVKK